jgi:hypothetical protein
VTEAVTVSSSSLGLTQVPGNPRLRDSATVMIKLPPRLARLLEDPIRSRRPRGARVLAPLLLASALGSFGFATRADSAPAPVEQACIVGVNKAQAGLVGAVAKAAQKCLKLAASGKLGESIHECWARADVDRAARKTLKTNQKKCRDKGLTNPPTYGWIDDPFAVNTAAFDRTLEALEALMGNPAHVAPSSDKDDARCQKAVLKGMAGFLDTLARETTRTKKDALKGKKLPQVQDASELAAALASGKHSARVAKARTRWGDMALKACPIEADRTRLFPGRCAAAHSLSEMIQCSEKATLCLYCLGIETADGVEIGCDRYDDPEDEPADFSCPLAPLGTTMTATTTTTGTATTTTGSISTTTSALSTTTGEGTTTTSPDTTTTSGVATTTSGVASTTTGSQTTTSSAVSTTTGGTTATTTSSTSTETATTSAPTTTGTTTTTAAVTTTAAGAVTENLLPCNAEDEWQFSVTGGDSVAAAADTVDAATAADLYLVLDCPHSADDVGDDELPCEFPPPAYDCPIAALQTRGPGTCTLTVTESPEDPAVVCANPGRANYALIVTVNGTPVPLTLTVDDRPPGL